jgi:hypothetical protein
VHFDRLARRATATLVAVISLLGATDESIEVFFEIKDAATNFERPRSLPLRCPHCESLGLMAEIERRIASRHSPIWQYAHLYVVYRGRPIRCLCRPGYQRAG